MRSARVTRSVRLPDQLRLARYLKAPELGPRILFFSGGTALNPLSRELVRYTHNSIHLVTPFDSGGSSAKLREAFHMPAVGDLRSRLTALADQTVKGNPEVLRLFTHRLPREGHGMALRAMLDRLCAESDPLIRQVPEPMRKIIASYLRVFQDRMPEDFDLRGASIGNLVLAAGYLTSEQSIDPVIFLFSKLAEVQGVVRPIINRYYHLAAELDNGEWIVGQHLLTGKEVPPITSRIRRFFISQNRLQPDPVDVRIHEKVRRLILQAELICYPMGSFYTSLAANLLPRGVGQAIAENDCPKAYVPNTGVDPEQFGMSLADNVRTLLLCLRQCCDADQPVEKLLNFVILDERDSCYAQPLELEAVEAQGVKAIRMPLAGEAAKGPARLDGKRLIETLLSLI